MLALSGSGLSCSIVNRPRTEKKPVLNVLCELTEKVQPAQSVTHLEPPQTPDVITAFKADRLQPLVQAALDTGQTRTASSNHRHTTSHASAPVTDEAGQSGKSFPWKKKQKVHP